MLIEEYITLGLFFERKETEKDIVIVQKPYFYYLIIGAMVSYYVGVSFPNFSLLITVSTIFWLAFSLFFVINLKSIITTRIEVSRYMKKGQVLMSGSRLSIKNPVTYTMSKRQEY